MKKIILLFWIASLLGGSYAEELPTNSVVYSHEQKMWALATAGVLTQKNGDNHSLLGGYEKNLQNAEKWKKILKKWWGVSNRQDLIDTLKWIDNGGHRAKFTEFYLLSTQNTLKAKSIKSRNVLNEKFMNKLTIAGKYGKELGNKSLLGWDYSRYVSLCRWGYLTGYLTEEEAWKKIMATAKLLQISFDSWEDLGNNYLIGRNFWSSYHTKRNGKRYEKAFQWLSNSDESPWKKYPWDLDLNHTQGTAPNKKTPKRF